VSDILYVCESSKEEMRMRLHSFPPLFAHLFIKKIINSWYVFCLYFEFIFFSVFNKKLKPVNSILTSFRAWRILSCDIVL